MREEKKPQGVLGDKVHGPLRFLTHFLGIYSSSASIQNVLQIALLSILKYLQHMKRTFDTLFMLRLCVYLEGM